MTRCKPRGHTPLGRLVSLWNDPTPPHDTVMTLSTLRPWMPRSIDAVPVDQARGLRSLLERRSRVLHDAPGDERATSRTIAVTSGKGGVGKSVIAVNLAVAFAQRGLKVCLLDGNQGLGNVALLCGLNSYWNLTHVIAGARRIEDVVLSGPAGFHVLPGVSGLQGLALLPGAIQQQLCAQLDQLERQYDLLIVDTGSSSHPLARNLAASADHTLIVTSPEPTSIADGYATLKSLYATDGPELSVIVNQSTEDQTARILTRVDQTARTFLHARLSTGIGIPADPVVVESVRQRVPFQQTAPGSAASRAVRRLADRLGSETYAANSHGYFARWWQRIVSTASSDRDTTVL